MKGNETIIVKTYNNPKSSLGPYTIAPTSAQSMTDYNHLTV